MRSDIEHNVIEVTDYAYQTWKLFVNPAAINLRMSFVPTMGEILRSVNYTREATSG